MSFRKLLNLRGLSFGKILASLFFSHSLKRISVPPSAQMYDVCLILEGTYPYVTGGVAGWTHALIHALPEYRFAILSIMPRDHRHPPKYTLPENVDFFYTAYVQKLEAGVFSIRREAAFFSVLRPLIGAILKGRATLESLRIFCELLKKTPGVGYRVLLNSRLAWGWMNEEYRLAMPDYSFLNFFWSWRSLLEGIFSMVKVELPDARVYHSVSTGYAGIVAAIAKVRTGRSVLLTEHGIYTNERRIEINTAEWLSDEGMQNLVTDQKSMNIRVFWLNSFGSYARMCYEAADRIVTLFALNQVAQIDDGADPSKMRIIPNGIDYEHFSQFSSGERKLSEHPTIALIGRVVPIKDIKTFIHACGLVVKVMPHISILILGPTDEDAMYADECKELAHHLGLDSVLQFTGQVKIEQYLKTIDLNILSSISEGQPLTILEAGAAGIPTVATNVGACSEILLGAADENPPLGPGGVVTGLADPRALAEAILLLLGDPDRYHMASRAIQKRVAAYYTKPQQVNAYRKLYQELGASPAVT